MRFRALAITLTALAATVLFAHPEAPDSSLAASPPSAQRFSIDMDPANFPANTATSLGSREPCAAMVEDNILNFDEDLTDTVEFDVAGIGIPPSNPMTGYTYTLSFPAPSTRIVYHQPMMIGPPIIILNNSDPVPDTDGSFNVSVVDPSGTAESGSGVLDRLRIQTNPAAIAGTYPLTLTNATHTDTNSNTWAPDALDNAIVEINSGGCPLLVDIEMVSLGLTSANPVPIGVDTTVTVDESIRNNSPYPVNTDAQTTFTVPSACTLNGAAGTVVLNAPLGVLPGMSTAPHQETPVLRCTTLGARQMPVEACAVMDAANYVEMQAANNCQTQYLNFDIVAPPGTDTDGDGVWDADEFDCGVPTFGAAVRPERMNGFDDDDDGLTDEALPPGSETWDCDGDGYDGATEAHVFEAADRDQRECGPANWVADFVSGGIPDSTDRATVTDLTSFLAPTRHLNTNVGDNLGNVRWDTMPGKGLFATDINIQDLTSLLVTAPAMFGGNRTFNGLACGAVGCSNALWCTDAGTAAGVAVRLETDRLVYHAGETVQMSLVATNTGGSNVALNFPDNCTALFMAVNTWSDDGCGLVCVPSCTVTLPPGGSITYTTTWDQMNDSGETVPRGDYQIVAFLQEDSCSIFTDCTVPTMFPTRAYHYIRLTQ